MLRATAMLALTAFVFACGNDGATDGTGRLVSEDVGGLSHGLEPAPTGPRVALRIGGTDEIWRLALRLQ